MSAKFEFLDGNSQNGGKIVFKSCDGNSFYCHLEVILKKCDFNISTTTLNKVTFELSIRSNVIKQILKNIYNENDIFEFENEGEILDVLNFLKFLGYKNYNKCLVTLKNDLTNCLIINLEAKSRLKNLDFYKNIEKIFRVLVDELGSSFEDELKFAFESPKKSSS